MAVRRILRIRVSNPRRELCAHSNWCYVAYTRDPSARLFVRKRSTVHIFAQYARFSRCIRLRLVAASYYVWPRPTDAGVAMQHNDIETAVSYIAALPIRPNTKVYANPNDHLLLTYYSGTPVQSIAAVRETFLNQYEGNVVLFQRNDFFVRPGDPIDPPHLQQAAQRDGGSLSHDEAMRLSSDLATYSHRAVAARRYAAVLPPLRPPPHFAVQEYAEWLRLREARDREYASKWVQFPMFRGFQIRSVYEWWNVFFFRFVNPQAELLKPNYETRMRSGLVTTLRGSNWTVYYSPR